MVRERKENEDVGMIGLSKGIGIGIIWLVCQGSGTTLGGSPSRTVEHHDGQADLSRVRFPQKVLQRLLA